MADEATTTATTLDRASFLALDKEKLFSLLELAVRGQQDTANNMVKMTAMMRKADETMKALRDEIEALKAANAALQSEHAKCPSK